MLRATLHLVTAKDFVAFRAAFSSMLERTIAAVLRERAKGLEIGQLAAQATKLLAAGPRTFEEVRDQLLRLNPGGDPRAMGYAVRCALPLVQVPIAAPWSFPGDPQFALASAWLGRPTGSDPDPRPVGAALPGRVRAGERGRHAGWSGLKELAEAFEALRPKLKAFLDPRGRELFDLPKAPRPDQDTPAPVRFLPDYDDLVLGHADRSRVIADVHRTLIATKNLQILPSFLLDGFVAGTWRIDRARASAPLTMKPFEPLAKQARAQLTAEASALLKFVELAVAPAECCVANPARLMGAAVDLPIQGPPHAWLFGEDASRAVISFSPAQLPRLEHLCAAQGVPFACVGAVGGEALELKGLFGVPVAELSKAWREGFVRALQLG